jgi:hypothetical protein
VKDEKAKTIGVSLKPTLATAAREYAASRDLTFSAYVRHLIRADLGRDKVRRLVSADLETATK